MVTEVGAVNGNGHNIKTVDNLLTYLTTFPIVHITYFRHRGRQIPKLPLCCSKWRFLRLLNGSNVTTIATPHFTTWKSVERRVGATFYRSHSVVTEKLKLQPCTLTSHLNVSSIFRLDSKPSVDSCSPQETLCSTIFSY